MTLKERFLDLAYKYRKIFATHETHLGNWDLVEHEINTGDSPPVLNRPYNCPRVWKPVIKEKVNTLLNAGIIQE